MTYIFPSYLLKFSFSEERAFWRARVASLSVLYRVDSWQISSFCCWTELLSNSTLSRIFSPSSLDFLIFCCLSKYDPYFFHKWRVHIWGSRKHSCLEGKSMTPPGKILFSSVLYLQLTCLWVVCCFPNYKEAKRHHQMCHARCAGPKTPSRTTVANLDFTFEKRTSFCCSQNWQGVKLPLAPLSTPSFRQIPSQSVVMLVMSLQKGKYLKEIVVILVWARTTLIPACLWCP